MLTPEEFQEAEDLFHELSELEETEQRARLQEVASTRPEMAERLGRMLAISERALETLTNGLEFPAERQARRDIPPYRLERLLGEGGMGEVWSALQTEPLRRRVAIKFVRSGFSQRAVLERFRSERQALALMDHPDIAKVFDAGADQEGRPYFVMELVGGEPITDACDRLQLRIPERLRLVARVCDAIQHAHRRGVIHRDLKPSNILVDTDADGRLSSLQLKVIDFGIAKVVDPTTPMPAGATALTVLGQPLGTLDYMSPEQASGVGVDTRTDVYALGVVLYQLLVGCAPLRRPDEELSLVELQRRISEVDPPALRTTLQHPSSDLEMLARERRTTARELSQLVRGELEWIVSKSLEKDPERRYDSPAALREDLERYLDHRPLSAGPAALGYRARKFARRHRGATLSAAAVLLTALLGAAGAGVGWSRSVKAERAAVQEAAESDATRDFLISLFEGSDPEGDAPRDLTAPDLLARGAERLHTELAGQPDLKAALSQTIGRLYVKLGLYPEATQHLERAVTLREVAGDPTQLGAALLELARHRMDTGDYEAAVQLYERAASELARSRTGDPLNDRVRSLTELSSAYRMLNRVGLGLARSQEARDLANRALDEASPIHVPVLSNHAALLWAQGDLHGAGEAWEQAIDHVRRHLGDGHYFLGSLQQNLGTLRRSQNRYEESIRLLREAERLEAERYGDDHPWLANLRASLAESLIAVGELDEAERLLDSALAILEDSRGAGLEYVLLQRGTLRRAQGRYEESLEIREQALERARAVFGELHQDTALAWLAMAESLRHLGELEEAERHAFQALEVIQAVYPDPNLLHGSYLFELVEIALDSGDAEQADRRLERAEEMIRAVAPPRATALTARTLRIRLLVLEGRLREARRIMDDVLAEVKLLGARHPLRREADLLAEQLDLTSSPASEV